MPKTHQPAWALEDEDTPWFTAVGSAPRVAAGNLAYAALAFAGVGLIALNLEAVGFTRVIAAAQQSLTAFVQRAWPSLLGLAFVGLVLA